MNLTHDTLADARTFLYVLEAPRHQQELTRQDRLELILDLLRFVTEWALKHKITGRWGWLLLLPQLPAFVKGVVERVVKIIHPENEAQ